MSPSLRRRREPGGKKRGPNPLVVAAVTIVLAVAITFWAFNGRQIPFVHHYTLYALVRNDLDIIPQSPVRIGGIDVGQVTGTSAAGGLTKIAFSMQSNGLPVHKDATVTIRDRLFLEGGYYLQLEPGSPSAPVAHDGWTIPVSNTAYPVQFYQLLSTFDVATRQSLENTLNTLNEAFSPPGNEQPTTANSGAGGLKSAIPQLTPTLKDVAWVTQALHGTQPGDVERLLSSASDVTVTLQRNSAPLADLVTSLDRASSALAASDGALAQSVSGLDQTLRVSPSALSAVDHALPPLTKLASTLDPSLKLAPPILTGINSAVNELIAIVRPAERARLLTSLKATFNQFPGLLTKLAGVFPVTKAVTDCLQTHVTPILKQQVPDGPLSSGEPVWQDFVHSLVGVSSAGQSFDANGYWLRLALAGGLPVRINVPALGNLVGETSASSPVLGSRPVWNGDLAPTVFQPGVPCSTQPVPGLQSSTGPSDLARTGATAAINPVTLGRLRAEFTQAAKLRKVRG